MIKKLITLIILLPILDIVLIFLISNYVTLYFIILQISFTFVLAIYIFNNLKQSNNLKLLNIFNNLKYINIMIFKFISVFCLILPGFITDLIGLLILNTYFQNLIKKYILYKMFKNNNFNNNQIFEGTFSHLDNNKIITNKKDR